MDEIIAIVLSVKKLVESSDADVLYTGYDSAAQFAEDLDKHAELLRAGDVSRLKELMLLFAPTGDLQEAAASSGWGDEYLELAKLFDLALKQLLV